MAKNKKSFILYTDSKRLVNKLPDDVAGRLFKLLFSYVSDENPKIDELLLDVSFEHFKTHLKRDLKKWSRGSDTRIDKARKAGLASAKKRQLEATKSNSVVKSSTKSTVSVSVSDSVSDNVNNILLEKETKELFNNWIDYRIEIKKPIKSAKTLIALANKIKLNGFTESEIIINKSIENQYQGLFWNNNKTSKADDELIEKYNL